MINDDPIRALLEYYPRIFFACHTRHVHDPATGAALSASQASVLDHLDEVEPMGLLALARHLGVTPATMSIAVDRLVRRGYVLRERDTADARRVRLRLSADGERVRSAKSVLDPALVGAMLATLNADDVARGIEGLAILARAANALMTSRSERGAWTRRSRKDQAAAADGGPPTKAPRGRSRRT